MQIMRKFRQDQETTNLKDHGTGNEVGGVVADTAKADTDNAHLIAIIEALGRSQAMIEFETDGTIVTANQNFLATLGYDASEIEGRHHGMFVEPGYKDSAEYRQFWDELRSGKFQAGEFKRIAKDGKEVWIQASYNPVVDAAGNVVKVVKYASDITEAKLEALRGDARVADLLSILEALSRSQAQIEFEPDGTIVTANQNFLATLGYDASEIEGKHHSMFVEPSHKDTTEYRQFWDELRTGKFQAGEFKRIAKDGKEVWIQASYNPVVDAAGNVVKVVKYASDITEAKLEALRGDARVTDFLAILEALSQSQAQIEFEPDGIIVTANQNFLATLGYDASEIEGKHYSMFVEPSHKDTTEYRQFWDELRSGKFQAGEFKRIAKDGKEVWIQASYNPVVDAAGNVVKVVKYASDITEAKLEALRDEARAEQFTQMVENLPIGVMMCDTEKFEIIYMNKFSTDTLKSLESHLPIKVANMVGHSIDVFYQVPSDQRNFLGDPKNLPHQANIEVGPEILDLLVSPITDQGGTYLVV